MSEYKHTTGPWRLVAGGFIQAPRRKGTDQHDIDIAHLYGFDADARFGDGFYAGEPLANGKLIEAAPDLLALVRRALAIENSVTMKQERELREGYVDELRRTLARVEVK